MKKTFALLLCLLLALSLFACKSQDAQTDEPTTTAAPARSEAVSEQGETASETKATLDFNGLTGKGFTLADVEKAEGRSCDFSFDENGTTVYVFNEMTVDQLYFSQVQISFGERTRISCTLSGESVTADTLNEYAGQLTSLYGEPSTDDTAAPTLLSWTDTQGNYAMLSMINDTTMQLAYYFIAE